MLMDIFLEGGKRLTIDMDCHEIASGDGVLMIYGPGEPHVITINASKIIFTTMYPKSSLREHLPDDNIPPRRRLSRGLQPF